MAIEDGPTSSRALSVTHDHRHGTSVLRVSGEIDVATGTKLRAGLGAQLDDPVRVDVIVDLRDVTFMSSTGIAALVDAEHQAQQHGKTLRIIAGDNRAVWTPLRLSGVDKMLCMDVDPSSDPPTAGPDLPDRRDGD